MPQIIEVTDATFAMLQSIAKPFVDTPETVIARLATDELSRRARDSSARTSAVAGADTVPLLNPDRHESLTHAKVLYASFNGVDLHRPKWNSLLDHVHVVARKRLGSFEAVKKISSAHLREGRYEQDGFHYLADADLSIQGVDSNFAWAHSLGIARHLRMAIRVRFEWRHKEGAARPGQSALLEWAPPSLSVA